MYQILGRLAFIRRAIMAEFTSLVRDIVREAFVESVGELHPEWSFKQQTREASRLMVGLTADDVDAIYSEACEL
jgi:hypothetical protein